MGNLTAKIQPQVERNLLVARAPCMQPLAEITDTLHELALDKRVHIFIGTVDKRRLSATSLENLFQRSRYLLRVCCIEDTCSGEPFNPCETSRHVVFKQSLVETERGTELKGN